VSSGATLTIDAAGEDIWGSSDQFHFVYQPVTGDVDVRARVDSLTAASEWSKAGVMIRSTLAANAAHGYALVAAERGVAFQRRTEAGAASTSSTAVAKGAPQWVRVVRSGNVISAFSSADGVSWTAMGSATVALGATAYVGIAVTSHNPLMRTVATVSNVTVTPTGMPTGQSSTDIGSTTVSGSTQVAANSYTVMSAGGGIFGSSDQFRYVYQPASGDVEVIARVDAINAPHGPSVAGVMIRESLAPGARHASALTSNRNDSKFRYRTETGATTDESAYRGTKLPGWVRLVRTGAVFDAYRSDDGANWTKMGSATLNMGETAYVGIAVASYAANEPTTAILSGLSIRNTSDSSEPPPADPPTGHEPAPSPTPSNVPPAVILSSPVSGATFTAPATVTMTASATDPDGTVTGVEFYVNSSLIGKDSAAPYSFASTLAAGTYAVKAVATDDDGAVTISESVTITVTAPTASTAPKGVAFQASADHDSLVSGYVLEIYAANGVPGVSATIAVSALGKPTPSSTGEIVVDRSAFFTALAPGNYLAAVTAVGNSGSTRSTPIAFTR
jgi:regulation of enolase protein 1 (concanavalin A-like superfamily)